MTIDPRTIDPRAFGVATLPDETEDAQTRAEDMARERWRRDAGARTLGLRLDEVGPGRAVMAFTVRDVHLDGHACRAAFVFALAEACLGYATGSTGAPDSWQMDGLASVAEGEALRAQAQHHPLAAAGGRAASLFEVVVTKADGTAVALLRARVPAEAPRVDA
jgi:acyl-CoA thioesterase